MSKKVDICKAHIEAEDRQDVEATVATFTDDDPYYTMDMFGISLQGKDEIRAHYERGFSAFPDFTNINSTYYDTDDPRIVFWQGGMESPHLGEFAGIEPTGKNIRMTRGVAKFIIADDGLLKAEEVIGNPVPFLVDVGVLPHGDLIAIGKRLQELEAAVAAAGLEV